MYKKVTFLFMMMILFSLTGCFNTNDTEAPISSEPNVNEVVEENTQEVVEENQEEVENKMNQIRVSDANHTIIFELNDSSAANGLYQQLPMEIAVDNFSNNEKIFYPEQSLDVSNTPTATGGAGTLAYYAPWGDVVMFYGDFSANSSLYELGHVVSGEEFIDELTGTLTIEMYAGD